LADKSIRATSATIDAMSSDWAMVDALMVGTAAMRVGGKAWLPQWPKESDDAYRDRLGTAVLHPVFKRTVLVNASRPFSRPVTAGDNTPAAVEEWMKDIDLQGTAFSAFALQIMTACLAKGLHGVLVDYPTVPHIKTQADEKAAGARPYWVHYPAGSILGWQTEKAAKGLRLTQIRLLEYVEVPNGDYLTKSIEQVRLLTPGAWAIYRQSEKDRNIWDEVDGGSTSLDFIPFKFFYGVRKAFGIGISPVADLAYQNVEHWQSASDQQTILHVARVPILFVKCLGDATLTVGAGSALVSENEEGDAKYVEHTGKAIEAGAESMRALEDRMRATGAELISLDAGYATATEVSSDSDASKSLLQQVCENFEESAQQCFVYMLDWVKEKGEPSIELYKDFGIAMSGDPATLGSAVTAGTVSNQTHFEELQRRDVVSADRTWEEEVTRLNTETTQAANDAATAAALLAKATPNTEDQT
jgi:hypothetical protein